MIYNDNLQTIRFFISKIFKIETKFWHVDIVASSDTEAGLRDHVMWLQSRDVAKVAVYRAGNSDPSISTYIENRSS
jgi:hypothetical protein